MRVSREDGELAYSRVSSQEVQVVSGAGWRPRPDLPRYGFSAAPCVSSAAFQSSQAWAPSSGPSSVISAQGGESWHS